MRERWRSLRSDIAQHFTDIVFVVGLAAISIGCLLIHPALGFIAGGTEMVAASIFWDRGKPTDDGGDS